MDEKLKTIGFEDPFLLAQIAGPSEESLIELGKLTRTSISLRGNELLLKGGEAQVSLAFRVIAGLYDLAHSGVPVGLEDVSRAVRLLAADENLSLPEVMLDRLPIASGRKCISPKSVAQKRYVDAIREHAMVFGIGPAGTGKTYLAVALAVSWLFGKRCKRIVLCRPAVEAGEKLGFLPGDIAEKVDPYLRPLFDALHEMVEPERLSKLIEDGIIEIAPLAFMRGRTLNDSFIILDEAQNTTPPQMKMFLTRLGFRSKAVITGDVTQIDLAPGMNSGLIHAESILSDTEGVSFCHFTKDDVFRHPLVARIIEAYDNDPNGNRQAVEKKLGLAKSRN